MNEAKVAACVDGSFRRLERTADLRTATVLVVPVEVAGIEPASSSNNAQQVNQLAEAASDVAVQGAAAVQQVIGTMKSSGESSTRIADIIGTIDGIAFLTNVLALNAAVEAARRRAGQRVCRGGRRGPHLGAAVDRGRARDQDADFSKRGAGGAGHRHDTSDRRMHPLSLTVPSAQA